LLPEIENAFLAGLSVGLEDESEIMFVRQHAYLLVFGIQPADMKSVIIEEFNKLLERANDRADLHFKMQKDCICQWT
jgi:flagellar motor component MotA